MQGRDFLAVARREAGGTTEADWRAAAGRAYYALMLESWAGLRRWGFVVPRRDQIHAFVRLRFSFASHADLKTIGYALDRLGRLINEADYQIEVPGMFATSQRANQAILDAAAAITLLDQIAADPALQTAAIAAIRTAWQ